MVRSAYVVVVWFLLLTQVWAAVNRITIYEEPNQKGDSITLTKKYANLPDWSSLLNKTGSYCLTGVWVFWDLPNFKHSSTYYGQQSRTEICANASFAKFNSAQFLGPADFDTPAIALYEGSNGQILGGREYVVTGVAGNNIQFTPTHALSYLSSSWTLFSGKDFDGKSWCFTPNQPTSSVYTGYIYSNSSFVVQSVVRGCDAVQVENNINLFKNNLNLN